MSPLATLGILVIAANHAYNLYKTIQADNCLSKIRFLVDRVDREFKKAAKTKPAPEGLDPLYHHHDM